MLTIPPTLYKAYWYGKRLLLDREALKVHFELERNQWLSRDELEAIQLKKLRELVGHADRNVPFYRQRFKEIGLEPGDIGSLSDFAKIPPLTKNDIREHREEIRSTRPGDIENSFLTNTGGSTGVPLQFYREKKNIRRDYARARSLRWVGYEVGKKNFHIWAKYGETSRKEGLLGYYVFNAFDVSDEEMHRMAKFLLEFRPYMISGYVSTLMIFTEFLKANGYRIRPEVVETTAEALSDEQRQVLEDYFQCTVVDFYGCNEIFTCATQCGHSRNLHWFEDIRYAEFVDEETLRPSEDIGELLITDLCNTAFPFIRYKVGDAGRFSSEQCSCGRTLRMIEPIKGRTYGTIITPSGKKIYSHFFTTLFYNREGVEQFQTIQHTLEDVEFRIVKNSRWTDDNESFIRQRIAEVMGPSVRVAVSFVDSIETTKHGKRIFTISKLH